MYQIHVFCTPAIQTLFNVNCIWKEKFVNFWWTQEWWGLRWGKQTAKGLCGLDTTSLGSQARRNKGPEKTLLAGGEGGISPLQLWMVSLFQTEYNWHSLTVQLLSPAFWEEPSYFSSSPSLNSSFNSPFTSLQKTQSCPESWAPCFPFYRKKGSDYTNHEIQGLWAECPKSL